MEYETRNLLIKFCPAIFDQIKKAKIDWKALDHRFKAQLEIKDAEHQTNIFNLAKLAEDGDSFANSFLSFINTLVDETAQLVPYKAKYGQILQGKINNTSDWNYLNPIGEIAVIKKLLLSKFELLAIEDKTRYPELSPKDFLFKTPMGKEYLIEILNIHIAFEDYANFDLLKCRLQSALTKKITKETTGIIAGNKTPLVFLPVLWNANLIALKSYDNYFAEFAKSFGKSDQHPFPVMGYCVFGKTEQGFHFGEITTFFDEKRYLL